MGYNLDEITIENLREAVNRLRLALVGLVGTDDAGELDGMEAMFRLADIPAADKTAMLDAIHALQTTA